MNIGSLQSRYSEDLSALARLFITLMGINGITIQITS